MFSSNVPEDMPFKQHICVHVCVYTLAHFVPADNISVLIQGEKKGVGGWSDRCVCVCMSNN